VSTPKWFTLTFALIAAAAPAAAHAQVLDFGAGAFSGPIVPSNAGRTSGWFWDNLSSDQNGAASACNVGFFAVGTMDPDCSNQAPGTLANQGGFVGASALGDGQNPSPFMFSGANTYNLTLLGSLAGLDSEVGIFTRTFDGSAWLYSFTGIASFGARVIGSTYNVGAGLDWGFFIRNSFNPAAGGCDSPDADCSDATGGFSGEPFQQFVLLRSANPGSNGFYRYLVGIEDNRLELLDNPSYWDSDYNDYMIEVTVTPEPLSMALMATGLVGLAGAGFLKRRRRSLQE
jgi:hypothetical protein